ncbi:MAG: cadherin repeat domain-containing protein, partial [Pseudomonadales bacterium]|nr:cadherin repeat domain-containing protein [Pseudomonadales bacterium]
MNRFVKIKTTAKQIAVVFLCAFFAGLSGLPANADQVLTNIAVLKYDGNDTQGVSASVDFTLVDNNPAPAPDDIQPPTDIAIDCQDAAQCSNLVIPENAFEVAVGAITGTDPDTALDDLTYEVVDDIRFEVVDGYLKLVPGEFIDYEAEQAVTLQLRVTDPAGNELIKSFTFEVLDVNEAPENLAVDNQFVPAGQSGSVIGALTFTDPDVVESHTLRVIDNERFVIEDGVLKLAPGESFGVDEQVNLVIEVEDKGGLTTQTTLTVGANPGLVRPPAPSLITFLAPDRTGETYNIVESACSPPAGFGLDAQNTGSGLSIFRPEEIPGDRQLAEADAYAIGDVIYIRVDDTDQDMQPFLRETIEITLETGDGGDIDTITLTETDVSTGVFAGYIYSTSQTSAANDCIFTVKPGDQLIATYHDPNDAVDIKDTTAFVAPIGVVFNDETGELINGVVLSLVDVSTGKPALVFGDGPGYARYPATVKTGEETHDAAGNVYPVSSGEYRFPAIPDGDYRIELFNVRGWEISSKPDGELQALAAASERSLTYLSTDHYFLTEASYGEVFHVSQGALPKIDIPLRPVPRVTEPPVVTPSEIIFLQYSANPAVGSPVDIAQSHCVSDQNSQAVELRNVAVPVPGVVNLLPTSAYKSGQPIFVQVNDYDQNNDPNVREKITIQLDVESLGDREYLELTESGPDTGEFFGYIQSTSGENEVGSCLLGVESDKPIQTTYTDAFDQTDVSDSWILVDPFGKLFSTLDGTALDGVIITVVYADTGEPAPVFGDGPFFAPYPSTLVTGGSTTDEAGLFYDFPPGEYRFPFMMPGFYRFELSNIPEGFIFPAVSLDEDAIQQLPGAPYAIVDGSDGGVFEV